MANGKEAESVAAKISASYLYGDMPVEFATVHRPLERTNERIAHLGGMIPIPPERG